MVLLLSSFVLVLWWWLTWFFFFWWWCCRARSVRFRVALGVEAVLADGSVVSRLAGLLKDDAGYDLPLLVGSEGTLAVVSGPAPADRVRGGAGGRPAGAVRPRRRPWKWSRSCDAGSRACRPPASFSTTDWSWCAPTPTSTVRCPRVASACSSSPRPAQAGRQPLSGAGRSGLAGNGQHSSHRARR